VQRAKQAFAAAFIAMTLAACGTTSGSGPESSGSDHPGAGGGPIANGLHLTGSKKAPHQKDLAAQAAGIQKKGLPTFRPRPYRPRVFRAPRPPKPPHIRGRSWP